MSTDKVIEAILDPEIVANEFKKEEDTKVKLQQLQTPVFRNFTIKKSKSVMHPLQREANLPVSISKTFEKTPSQTTVAFFGPPNVTTIRFGFKGILSRSEPKNEISIKTLPSFSPRKSAFQTRKTLIEIDSHPQHAKRNPESTLRKSISEKIKASQQRDSQTILRKNTLFLVNCLKTKYKETQKKAHIGGSQNVENMKLGFFSEKQMGSTHYQQRFEYMQEARQRLGVIRHVQEEPQIVITSPLHPEPW